MPPIRILGGRGLLGRAPAAVLLFALLLALAPWRSASAETFDVVSKLKDTSAQTVWRIDSPNPKQHETTYPTIKFVPGDRISIDAGGCVQTGGSGRTWKLYVNPSGPNADRLYHGLISVPGVANQLVRIQSFGLNTNKQISNPLPAGVNAATLILHLGYEDDNYSDNGYWGHDDGTEDQCKNIDHAWIIVSIGHDGVLPANPAQFVGILPANFRCQAAWAFHNFDTSQLSWSSFANAFNLGPLDYLDPATYITFLAARGNLASGGNCMGMSLLATVGEDQFVVGDLRESFWSNYKTQSLQTPAVTSDINTAHWKQLSAFFLRQWLGSIVNAPETTAASIERDLSKADFNYGVLSLTHGSEGHVLVPLQVGRSGNQILIDVYDPNRPCGSIPDTAHYPQLTISGGKWSYVMAGGTTWSGSSGLDNPLGYIPYVGEDGWSDLGTNIAGLAKIIFGAGVTVEQVTDQSGRRLFVDGQPGVLDTSANGLGRSLLRLPAYAADPKRPRSSGAAFGLNHAVATTSAVDAQLRQLDTEYADYLASGQIYIAPNAALSNLTFTVSSSNAAKPVRALVSQGTQFLEVRAMASGAAALHPNLVVHNLANLSAGMTMSDRNGAAAQVVFSQGEISRTAGTVTIQRTDPLALSPSLKLQSVNDQVQVLTTGQVAATRITTQVQDIHGGVTAQPARQMMMLRLQ